jgi:predicted PurR-regulated permease PerM
MDYITSMTQTNRNTTMNDRLTSVLAYGVLILLGYLVFLILAPFFTPIAWSAVLAIFFSPFYHRLTRHYSPTWAALICTLGVTTLLILPVTLCLIYATREAMEASTQIRAALSSGGNLMPVRLTDLLRNHLPESWQNVDITGPFRQGEEKIASYLASQIGSLVKDLFSFFVSNLILIFALFFMFRDGQQVVRAVRHLLPFESRVREEMLRESRDLIFASVAVALVMAAMQGVLGGLAFQLSGLTAPIFMGVLIAFFSVVPVVGSSLIWFPASLWLGFTGHWGKALLVFMLCGVVATIADNLVRPLLLHNRSRLNELLLFLSILGGLSVFGLLGLVIGPTIVAAALGILQVQVETQEQLEKESA